MFVKQEQAAAGHPTRTTPAHRMALRNVLRRRILAVYRKAQIPLGLLEENINRQ